MQKIYVGCALTGAPEESIQSVKVLKERLREEGYEVMEFFGLGPGDPLSVYETDIHGCVAECDMVLAICDRPSTGLGWEIGTAVEHHRKPVLAVAHKSVIENRLLTGAAMSSRNPLYRFERYETHEDIVRLVNQFFSEIGLKV